MNQKQKKLTTGEQTAIAEAIAEFFFAYWTEPKLTSTNATTVQEQNSTSNRQRHAH